MPRRSSRCLPSTISVSRPGAVRAFRYVSRVPELLGYAWVSTLEQNADPQRDALTAAGCRQVFVDHVSGTREQRPELDRVLEQLRPGDTLVVCRLDRLSRSLQHLISIVTGLTECGVGFRSLTEDIDTSTAGGRLIFALYGLTMLGRDYHEENADVGADGASTLQQQGLARRRPGDRSLDPTPDVRSLMLLNDTPSTPLNTDTFASIACVQRAVASPSGPEDGDADVEQHQAAQRRGQLPGDVAAVAVGHNKPGDHQQHQ